MFEACLAPVFVKDNQGFTEGQATLSEIAYGDYPKEYLKKIEGTNTNEEFIAVFEEWQKDTSKKINVLKPKKENDKSLSWVCYSFATGIILLFLAIIACYSLNDDKLSKAKSYIWKLSSAMTSQTNATSQWSSGQN